MSDEIIKCQYCDKPQEEGKDIKKHERFCAKNPNSVRSKRLKSSDPEGETFSSAKPFTPQPPSVDTHKPLIISEVQPSCIDAELDDVAWFMDDKGNRKYKVPIFIGMLDGIPHNLITTIDGTLIPAVLLPGFIGMHSKYHDFSEQDTPADQMPAEPTEAIHEPIKSDLAIDNKEPDTKPLETGILQEYVEQKKSFFAKIFSRKEKKEAPLLSSDTKELLKKIAIGGEV